MIRTLKNKYYVYRLVAVMLLMPATLSSCYTYRVETKAQAGSEVSHANVNSYFWGAIKSPATITTPLCDSLNTNGVAEVTVKSNFGYSLITVLTLGIWSPGRVEWKCGKPCQRVGNL